VPYNTCALIHPTLLDTHVIRIGNISFLFYTPLSITHILSSAFLQAPCPHPHSHSLHALFLHLSHFIPLKFITQLNFKPICLFPNTFDGCFWLIHTHYLILLPHCLCSCFVRIAATQPMPLCYY